MVTVSVLFSSNAAGLPVARSYQSGHRWKPPKLSVRAQEAAMLVRSAPDFA
jgi:hypothetical protein